MPQPSPRWTTAAELSQVDVPPGGTTDQVLAKNSNADRDLKWADPGGGGGSFLSANTARVDPSGNDGTGEIGDLNKPFLTVQGAVDAIEALDPIPDWPVVDVGNNDFSAEDITTSLSTIAFTGSNNQNSASQPFSDITYLPETGDFSILLKDCIVGGAVGTAPGTSGTLNVYLINATVDSVQNEIGGILIDGYGNSLITGSVATITNDQDINVSNVVFTGNSDITCAGESASVIATNCTLVTVTSTFLQCANCRFANVNFIAAEVSPPDPRDIIFPVTSDPLIAGALWNDSGTPAISEGPPP